MTTGFLFLHLVEQSLTLIDRSSPPRATMTLMGGRVLLASWVSMVALIAFYKKEKGGCQLLDSQYSGSKLSHSMQDCTILCQKISFWNINYFKINFTVILQHNEKLLLSP